MKAWRVRKIVFFSTDPGSPKDVKRIAAFREGGIETKAFGFFRAEVKRTCGISGIEWQELGAIRSGGGYLRRLRTMFSSMRGVIARERAPGTLFYYSGYDVGIVGFLLGGRDFIFEISDLMHTAMRFPWNAFGGVAARLLIWRSRCTIFTSEGFLRYFFGETSVPGNVVVVENKIAPEFAEAPEPPPGNCRGNGILKIGFVGNWGFSATYNFFEVASRRFPGVEFHIWGGTKSPGESGDLSKLAGRSNIFFHGVFDALRDLDKIYPQIDAVVAVYTVGIPNVRFAEPNKLYEAIFFRTPIIVSAGTFLEERVRKLGVGFSVDAESEAEIIRLVEGLSPEVLERRREAIREIPRDYAVFNPAEVREKILQTVNDELAKPKTPKTKQRILLVFGTRPEAIKMAPLVKAFRAVPEKFETLVCATGQHREMLDQVLTLFEIVPDYDLNIMKAGQDLYDVTARVLTGMRKVLAEANPDVVFVHGDTTTSTAAALAAFYARVPVAHIEAGLRTHEIYSPWPEEMNRQITGRIATLHFAPTPLARENLLKENVPAERIFVTGNTVIDALHSVVEKLGADAALRERVAETLAASGIPQERLEAWSTGTRRMVLITGHRRENFGEGFLHMCAGIRDLNLKYPGVDFVYPMHLNPNVRKPIREVFGADVPANMFFVEPQEYLPFVRLMELSAIVLTDSGGIQEEAPGLGKPVLVMRDTTERPEALAAGTVKLVGTNREKIVAEVSRLLDDSAHYASMSEAQNPYGDGNACKRIVEIF